jgi:hypothetical protein
VKQLKEIQKASTPRVREIKVRDPTELDVEESPIKSYRKTNDGLKRKRKDFYKEGRKWLD